MAKPRSEHPALDAIRKSGANKIKVACSDIDGILRGKYLHKDKFEGAADSGFGFCDVVFGWDSSDSVYDNTHVTGWQHGFPDALARLDLDTHRNVPWDGGVPFFLGHFVKADGSPLPICPRQVLRRVLARAEKMGFRVMVGSEYEFFNFVETPQSWAGKKGVGNRTGGIPSSRYGRPEGRGAGPGRPRPCGAECGGAEVTAISRLRLPNVPDALGRA